MKKIILNFEITGCVNNCYHCHCSGGAKQRKFMTKDDVINLASKFRDELDAEISVRLVQEQTYYPNFFELIIALENLGFMRKGNKKMLVTNCWGLANRDGFVYKLKNHFGVVKTTLFGIGKTHDIHAGRKGSFDEIVKATKDCIKQGIDVVWQIMLTRKNSKEIDQLYKVGQDLGVENIFITGEHYYTGKLLGKYKIEQFFPQVSNLKDVKNEIYELKNGLLKSENEYIDDIRNNIDYEISNIDFQELYIDKEFNVYPVLHVSSDFLLGNAKKSFDKIIGQILYNKNLPSSIIEKNKLNFKDLVKKVC